MRLASSVLEDAAGYYLPNSRMEIVPTHQVADRRLTNLLNALEAERAGGYAAGREFLDGIEMALATLLVRSYSTTSKGRGSVGADCLPGGFGA
ncbi:MAG: hypothetical protein WDO73_29365 [Ignavibacteriota bacterium]